MPVLCPSRMSYKWNHIVCNPLRLVFSMQYSSSETHPSEGGRNQEDMWLILKLDLDDQRLLTLTPLFERYIPPTIPTSGALSRR